jgi:hypothetical protein
VATAESEGLESCYSLFYQSYPTRSRRPGLNVSLASALVSVVILAYEAEKRHQK